jgi:N-acetylglucosaminyldiphosphoundecaprenol N-acetyl-beta-D-mannosaminyltransferase
MILKENRETKQILSLNIDVTTYKDAQSTIEAFGKNKLPGYVCFANVHMTIEACDNPTFARQVNNATLVLPDGMPIVKSLNLLYGVSQERIAGMDIFPDLLKKANELKLSVFFFGSTNDVLQRIIERVRREFTDLTIAGSLSPPFNQSINNSNYIDIINNSNANLVFVALGCPKQEIWMATHSHFINSVLLGVGGAFPVFAGMTKRAPKFMQNAGLEWLYRLIQEPTRLFGRYFKTNIKFLFLLTRDILSAK